MNNNAYRSKVLVFSTWLIQSRVVPVCQNTTDLSFHDVEHDVSKADVPMQDVAILLAGLDC